MRLCQVSSLLAATWQPKLSDSVETRYIAQLNHQTCAKIQTLIAAKFSCKRPFYGGFWERSCTLTELTSTLVSRTFAKYGSNSARRSRQAPQTHLGSFSSFSQVDLPESLFSNLLQSTAVGVGAVRSVLLVSAHLRWTGRERQRARERERRIVCEQDDHSTRLKKSKTPGATAAVSAHIIQKKCGKNI